MPHSYGFRAGTRSLLKKKFRKHGLSPLSVDTQVYRIGDYVDIKIDGAVHGGMPHRVYHGKTGRVFAVFPNAIGVVVHKVNGNHYEEKRLHVLPAHIRLSRCNAIALKRKKMTKEEARKDALPKGPREAHVVCGAVPPREIDVGRSKRTV
ncbi:MAG: 60S ribosomal protein L21 [Amphiamblys sp. WSBS2006]|nr:MAG: 60S ribosomal protein L21 [Amphiamblys sp. WSBS2006]